MTSKREQHLQLGGALKAVLFDRDGTLIVDHPCDPEPDHVQLMPAAAEAVRLLRDAGFKLGVVTNQAGIARGVIREDQVLAVNERVDGLLGGLDVWEMCVHGPQDGCGCRKPRPGMVLRAAGRLGVSPSECVVVGDVGADVRAALAAGAWPVLVPNARTLSEEVEAAPSVADDLVGAAHLVLTLATAPYRRGAASRDLASRDGGIRDRAEAVAG
jgi:D-glycero-D-manno-heptose 1,7-bisphosphate phosphatase